MPYSKIIVFSLIGKDFVFNEITFYGNIFILACFDKSILSVSNKSFNVFLYIDKINNLQSYD